MKAEILSNGSIGIYFEDHEDPDIFDTHHLRAVTEALARAIHPSYAGRYCMDEDHGDSGRQGYVLEPVEAIRPAQFDVRLPIGQTATHLAAVAN